MMEIKILGTGCPSCKALFETTQQAVSELGIEANVVKEEDMVKIMQYNVFSVPAVVIDEKVVSVGKKLSLEQVKNLLKNKTR